MADPSTGEFDEFLVGDRGQTRFLEWRLDGRLLAVAVTDLTERALSAVYTFFDPACGSRSLGTQAILGQVGWARATGRLHLYLGYWLQGHPRMDYKRRFQPLERLADGGWVDFGDGEEPGADAGSRSPPRGTS